MRECPDDILALNEALDDLAASDAKLAELVKLRFFGGLTIQEAAGVLGISPRSAVEFWTYAKAWLLHEIENAT